jgi:hypothetical protein
VEGGGRSEWEELLLVEGRRASDEKQLLFTLLSLIHHHQLTIAQHSTDIHCTTVLATATAFCPTFNCHTLLYL